MPKNEHKFPPQPKVGDGREPKSHENLDSAEVSRRSDEPKVPLDLPQAHRR